MGINAFFRETLGANVRNERWSWGARHHLHDRLFLRIWEDQIESIDGEPHALLLREHWTNSNGYGERALHIEAIRSGAEAFGVRCTHGNTGDRGPRSIKTFDQETLVRLGDILVRDDGIYARILGEVPAAHFQRAPSEFSTLAPDLRTILGKRIEDTTRESLIEARVGQGRFRAQVLELWNRRCAVTGAGTLEAIRASHIRPWRESTDEQRLDPHNGLPLVASLDALFDAGLICFKPDGLLVVSSALSDSERTLLGLTTQQRLTKAPPIRTSEYLEYHREEIFRS